VKQNKFPTNEKNSTPLRGVQFSNAYLNSVSEKKNFFPGKFFGGFCEKNDCQFLLPKSLQADPNRVCQNTFESHQRFSAHKKKSETF
jgi:hypothetical protein